MGPQNLGLPALIQRTKRRQTELDGLLYQLTTVTTAVAARADERLHLATEAEVSCRILGSMFGRSTSRPNIFATRADHKL